MIVVANILQLYLIYFIFNHFFFQFQESAYINIDLLPDVVDNSFQRQKWQAKSFKIMIVGLFCTFWTHFGLILKLTNFFHFGPFLELGPGLWALVGTTRAWPTNIVVPPIIPTTYAKKFPEIPESTWAKKLRLIFASC